MFRGPLLLCVFSLLPSCVSVVATLLPGAERVMVRKGDAPEGAVEVGPIEATDGSGCGGFGERGTYGGAYAVLRNAAYLRGANFVRIDSMEQPHMDPRASCFRNEFTLLGMAFKVPGGTAVQTVLRAERQQPDSDNPPQSTAPPLYGDPACRGKFNCKVHGKCTEDSGTCMAVKEADCQQAVTCTRDGNCQVIFNRCGTKRQP